jgi:DNA-binding transcriptional LysR family regulator
MKTLMDLVPLRTFVAVAEEGNMTRAAERLHVSPSAASAHVKIVEEAFRLTLFRRTSRGLELTYEGRSFVARAKTLLNEATGLASFARELVGKVSGGLSMGCSSDPALNRIAAIVAALHTNHPGVRIALQARTSSSTLEGLHNGELDAGILLGKPSGKTLVYLPLCPVKYRIAGPAAWKDRIAHADLQDLARLEWITPLGSGLAYARMLNQLFLEHGVQPNTVVETDNDVLVRALIIEGVGLSLVREDHAMKAEREGKMAVARVASAEMTLMYAYPAARADDPALRALTDTVATVWEQTDRVSVARPAAARSD